MSSGFNSARSKGKTGSKLNVPSATALTEQNLALMRLIALNALNQEQSLKRSNRQKSHRAAIMDNNYMLTILAACLCQHDDASLSTCQ